ncbi:hypothetical protein [Brevundimonas nasdae]|uniref:hypothetical protein n=1 Tax=Brevundimonas nasdae TaxID=172043 RepID=UPI003F68EEBA
MSAKASAREKGNLPARRTNRLDRRNISLACYQMGSDVVELTADLVRFEQHHSSVWQESAHGRIARIRADLDEIERVIRPVRAEARA